jgi:hypothetical protein
MWSQTVVNQSWFGIGPFGTCLSQTSSTFRQEFDPEQCPYDPCAGGCQEPENPCGESDAVFDDCGCRLCYSPIFVQLVGQGFEFSSPREGVLFDMFGSGTRTRVAWPMSEGTAWVALDRNHNGVIDDGTELFGNTRRLASGQFARNGYEVLAELDANGDRVIDSRDPAFSDLVLWEDRNRDGISQASELRGLHEADVLALYLDPTESRRVDRWGNRFRYRAKVDASEPPLSRFSNDVFLTALHVGSSGLSCGVNQKRD